MTQPMSWCKSFSPSIHPFIPPFPYQSILSFSLLSPLPLPHSLNSNPLVTAITLIDYHHVDILGDSLAEIAWQKGGIFKVSPH